MIIAINFINTLSWIHIIFSVARLRPSEHFIYWVLDSPHFSLPSTKFTNLVLGKLRFVFIMIAW